MTWNFYLPTLNPTGVTGACGGAVAGAYQGYMGELFSYVHNVTGGNQQFRKLYIQNDAAYTMTGVKAYLTAAEHVGQISIASGDTTFATGYAHTYASGYDSTDFSAPTTYGAGVELGSVAADGYVSVWLMQYLTTGDDTYASVQISVQGRRS